MQISLKTVDGKNINLEVDDSSDNIDLKIHGPTRELVLRLGPNSGSKALLRLFISTLGGKEDILEVKENEIVRNVMAMIHKNGGPSVKQQKLIFQGKLLDPGRTLADYNIKTESMLVMLSSMCGC